MHQNVKNRVAAINGCSKISKNAKRRLKTKNECAGYKTINASRGHINTDSQIYKNVILHNKITKMPLRAKMLA